MKDGLRVIALAVVCCGGLPVLLAVLVALASASVVGEAAVLGALAVGTAAVVVRRSRRRKAAFCKRTARTRAIAPGQRRTMRGIALERERETKPGRSPR